MGFLPIDRMSGRDGLDPRFEVFIQEKKYLRNVSPAVQWYRDSLKWLPSPTPDEATLDLRDIFR